MDKWPRPFRGWPCDLSTLDGGSEERSRPIISPHDLNSCPALSHEPVHGDGKGGAQGLLVLAEDRSAATRSPKQPTPVTQLAPCMTDSIIAAAACMCGSIPP